MSINQNLMEFGDQSIFAIIGNGLKKRTNRHAGAPYPTRQGVASQNSPCSDDDSTEEMNSNPLSLYPYRISQLIGHLCYRQIYISFILAFSSSAIKLRFGTVWTTWHTAE